MLRHQASRKAPFGEYKKIIVVRGYNMDWFGALLGLALGVGNAWTTKYQMDKAIDKQNEAQAMATAKQEEADYNAEKARLEALAKNQEATNEFDFGVDSALAKRYRDAAQKWGAGTGEMSQKEEEENPFYSRGLF